MRRLIRFSLGSEDAIRDLAADRDTLWLGGFWVLSAALARRYDRADLFAEPWHLVMPLLVSWTNATILFAMAWWLLIRRARDRPRAIEAYRVMLGLFWMTAPLAWLYAVPVERFLSPVDAMRVNLWLLLIVATWRVLLYARILAVLVGESLPVGLWLTLLFGDAVAVGMLLLSPKPIIALMGGIEHRPQDQLILSVTTQVILWGLITLPIWLAAAVVTSRLATPVWRARIDASPRPRAERQRRWLAVVLALVVWLPILPSTQAEQRLASAVDRALVAGDLDAAVERMASRERGAFPPDFDPRPQFWAGRTQPSAWRVLDAAERLDAPPWVIAIYEAKIARDVRSATVHIHSDGPPWWQDADTIRAMTRMLASRPEHRIGRFYRTASDALDRDPSTLDEATRSALIELMALWPEGVDHGSRSTEGSPVPSLPEPPRSGSPSTSQ